MKKSVIIGMVVALGLLLLSSCSANKSDVAQVSLPLQIPSAPTTPAPVPTAAQLPPTANTTVGNQVGNQAPDFQLNDLNGKPVSLSDFRGKPVLLNFWATW